MCKSRSYVALEKFFKYQFSLNYDQKHTKIRKRIDFTIYSSFIYIYKYETKINYFNKLSASSSSSLPYSFSSEYSSSFSKLPTTFHIFWQCPSHLQSSEHPICDFTEEHPFVLHFEIKKKIHVFKLYVLQNC